MNIKKFLVGFAVFAVVAGPLHAARFGGGTIFSGASWELQGLTFPIQLSDSFFIEPVVYYYNNSEEQDTIFNVSIGVFQEVKLSQPTFALYMGARFGYGFSDVNSTDTEYTRFNISPTLGFLWKVAPTYYVALEQVLDITNEDAHGATGGNSTYTETRAQLVLRMFI